MISMLSLILRVIFLAPSAGNNLQPVHTYQFRYFLNYVTDIIFRSIEVTIAMSIQWPT